MDAPHALAFGPYVLDPRERRLTREGRPMPLSPRLLAVLTALVQGEGRLVTKEELIAAAWGNTVVEENALPVAVSRLRAVLGRDTAYIETAVGHGYRFVAPVTRRPPAASGPPEPDGSRPVPPSYHEARFHWARRMDGHFGRALAAFEAATEADPAFAPAWTGIADVCVLLTHLTGTPPGEAFPRAREAAERALALAPDAPEPLVPLAHVAWRYDWDAPEAERLLRRALALDPESVPARQVLGLLLSLTGRADEGLSLLRDTLRLDPEARMDLGYAAFFSRRFDEAERHLRELLAEAPGHPMARLIFGMTLEALGREAEGRTEVETSIRLGGPHPVALAVLARAQARAGEPEEARALLAELERQRETFFVPPTVLAPLLDALGDREAALDALDRAVKVRDPLLIHLAAHPHFDGLREEPRFRALAWRVGLDVGPAPAAVRPPPRPAEGPAPTLRPAVSPRRHRSVRPAILLALVLALAVAFGAFASRAPGGPEAGPAPPALLATEPEEHVPSGDARHAAREAVARGEALFATRRLWTEALHAFRGAVALDSTYAPAHAGVASVLVLTHAAPAEVEAALERALTLDPALGEAYATLAFHRGFGRWDWQGAEAAVRRARTLAPGHVRTHQWDAALHLVRRRFADAEAALGRSLALDPDAPNLHSDVCEVRIARRDFAGARAACERALALDPDFLFAREHVFWLNLHERSPADAAHWAWLTRLYARPHIPANPDATAFLAALAADLTATAPVVPFDAYHLARIEAVRGNTAASLDALALAVRQRAFHVPFANADPAFDGVRDDPRFRALMREVGLPE